MRLSAVAASFACVFLIFGCATPPAAPVAAPDMAAQRAAMEPLSFLVGHWTGETRAVQPDGSVRISRSEDDVALLNAGTTLTIHGRSYAPGAAPDAAPVGENLGVITYNDVAGQYTLHVFALGAITEGEVRTVENGAAQWFFEGAGGLLRFDVRADGPDRWIEEIHLSRDGGATWAPLMDIRFGRRPGP